MLCKASLNWCVSLPIIQSSVQREGLLFVRQLKNLLHLGLRAGLGAEIGEHEGGPDTVGREEEVSRRGNDFLEEADAEGQDVVEVRLAGRNLVVVPGEALGGDPRPEAQRGD